MKLKYEISPSDSTGIKTELLDSLLVILDKEAELYERQKEWPEFSDMEFLAMYLSKTSKEK